MTRPERELQRHPIRIVARRTGLKADLIRAWERRYRAVEPTRDSDNQRLYSDRDVDRLILLQQLVESGRKISQVAQLDDAALQQLVDEEQAGAPAAAPDITTTTEVSAEPAALRDAFLDALQGLEARRLNAILEQAAVALGPRRAVVEVVYPLVDRIADLADRGALRQLHVNLARTVARGVLSELGSRGHTAPETAPRTVVAAPVGDNDIGVLLLAAIASCEGWLVTSLGSGLPAEEIVAAARQIDARCVIIDTNRSVPPLRLVNELAKVRRLLSPDVAVLVGGDGVEATAREPGWPDDLAVVEAEHLHEVLSSLRLSPRRRPAGILAPGRHRVHVPKAEPPPLHLPISEPARSLYRFSERLFGPDGSLAVVDIDRARQVSQVINERRDVANHSERGVSAGQLNAAALLHDFAHRVIARYFGEHGDDLISEALEWLDTRHGESSVSRAINLFVDHYDFRLPVQPDAGDLPTARLDRQVPPSEVVLEEMLVVWLANQNPALAPIRDLFDDRELEAASGYRGMIADLEQFFAGREGIGAGGRSLFTLLRLPFLESPGSLIGQLELLVRLEGELSRRVVERLLLGLDLIREEYKPGFVGGAAPPDDEPDYLQLPYFDTGVERYSPERSWMASLVLQAKHTLVWLDQLSQRYKLPISRLDEIPDAALADLAANGVNGLWLIGVWQRSRASQRIKQLTGNPEAAASAYAIHDYRIADSLGGDRALQVLSRRAREHGIRLGCDVVANHMGLDSPWVLDHPDRFLWLPHSPYPAYTFSGPDLSERPDIGLHIADQYYDRSDAAVVFRRIDRRSGEERFLYHGNDGTSLPWNDTAQLDYLNPEARETMIRSIVEVAQRFEIVRLDAAMTLARRHIQRLWYPQPGAGGAIPSRSGRGLAAVEFDRRMPQEFWQQVVERVVAEAPQSLLLAEAFWLLEGYFVRELGMHRVYNSAFMHLLRDEHNAKLRSLLAHWLAVDPEVLARFSNFLTNPDEQPAAEQFGTGDKYFGTCVLMATLPGLPVLGHGQVEGFTEKYGMEYQIAYMDELPDQDLIARHRREIVPLLRDRQRFAASTSMRLYGLDLAWPRADTDENVIAFSTGRGPDLTLVVFNNTNTPTSGTIWKATPFLDKQSGALLNDDLTTLLGPALLSGTKVAMRDRITNRTYPIATQDLREKGLHLDLGPYEYQVFTPTNA